MIKREAAYVMPPYWQCADCLRVTHDPTWTGPEHRKCSHCGKPAAEALTWPGAPGEVYHAALHWFETEGGWIATSMRMVLLSSLAEVHESRLIWAVLLRRGCSRDAALAVERGLRRTDFLGLFRELVGKNAKEFRSDGKYEGFWRDLQRLRQYRNDFVHREPVRAAVEPGAIPGLLTDTIVSVADTIEPAFQQLTNRALHHMDAGA